ncbi:MAG: xanthine dehydrogenase small subunit [Gammaproteobacteria bacterium]|nr:xanthine dehydrogenase small subunit [Gammaproteobacteria bacterium]
MNGEQSSDAIQFVLDGTVIRVRDLPPTLTVLEYLREIAHRTGTKEGCAEGDCGACMVVVGELTEDGLRVRYRAINSCIRLLPTIDGRELITVESLRDENGALHPAQQAMLEQHGSQCGFCTPGFVMALFALYLECDAPDRERVLEALSGNLCRCTGYRPIIDAGCRMHQYPRPLRWSREAANSSAHSDPLRSLRRTSALRLPGFFAPRTTDELAAALEAEPAAVLLAGGTDIGLWITKDLREPPAIIYIGEVDELKRIRTDPQTITIGAAVSLADAWQAIVAAYPQLAEVALRFGSPPVRHSGTLCGNIANGSPIGDCMPALMALDAELELRRGTQTRHVALERFYPGYRRKDLAPGEFLSSMSVPLPKAGLRVAAYKVSKRFEQDISAVCGAFSLLLDGENVVAARIAYGGMAAVPARARAAEAALERQPLSEQSISTAIARLADDFLPITDVRASGEYRMTIAGNLLRRFYAEQWARMPRTRTADAARP